MDENQEVIDLQPLGLVFALGDRFISSKKLDKLLFREDPKYKEKLKLIVIEAATNDNFRVISYLFNQGYEIDILNDKNQTLTHIAYYSDTHLILQRSEGLAFSKCNYRNFIDCNGLSHLHIACATGYVDVVKKFLDNGEDVHACLTVDCNGDKAGFTLLHFAVAHHQIEVVKLLLERGADINAKDSSGMTPLHLICAVSWDFQKFMDTESLIKSTSWTAELDVLKLLLEHNSDINARNDRGNTPLLSIFKNDYYFDPLKTSGTANEDPLTREDLVNLLEIRQLEKCKILIDHGVDINVKNFDDETILHRIIEDLIPKRFSVLPLNKCCNDKAYADVIEALFKSNRGLDVDAKNAKGETPIALAVSLINPRIVDVLLNYNPDLSSIDIKDQRFFRYPNVILSADVVICMTTMISKLARKGFQLTLEINLTIMKFLAHDVDDCDCGQASPIQMLPLLASQLLFYGSSAHMERVVMKVAESSIEGRKESLLVCIRLLVEYAKLISYMLFVDEKILKMYENMDFEVFQPILEEWAEDVNFMKSMTLRSGVSLYDIVTKNQSIASIFDYFESDVCATYFKQPLKRPLNGMLIISHFTKAILRLYVETAALKKYVIFILPFLPDLCRKMILEYLSIEDILRLCEAALLELHLCNYAINVL